MTKLDIFLMREAIKNICSSSKEEVPITDKVLLSLLDDMERSDALMDDKDWYLELVKPLEDKVRDLEKKINYQDKIIKCLAKKSMGVTNES